MHKHFFLSFYLMYIVSAFCSCVRLHLAFLLVFIYFVRLSLHDLSMTPPFKSNIQHHLQHSFPSLQIIRSHTKCQSNSTVGSQPGKCKHLIHSSSGICVDIYGLICTLFTHDGSFVRNVTLNIVIMDCPF